MWPFKRKTKSQHYENEDLDSLQKVVKELDGSKYIGESMNIVGNVDIVTFKYEVHGQPLSITVENYSGIELVGKHNIVEEVDLKLRTAKRDNQE